MLNNANEGLNDNTAVAPIGGNIGVTLGQQRQNVIHFAAHLLEQVIESSVPITIDAEFEALSCSSNAATLGSSGPSSYHYGNASSNYPVANTYYVQALANSIIGNDLSTDSDMTLTFNSDIDNNNDCLANRNWYYGLDGNTSAQDIDFLSTVLHETLHGLGFLTLVNVNTGSRLSNRDDIFSLMLEDHSEGKTWQQMTNAERVDSASDDPDLHWIGSNVQAKINVLNAGTNQGHVRMHAPSPINSGSSVSHFSSSVSPSELMQPSLNQPANSIGLAKALLQDIGWTTSAGDKPIIADIGNVEIINSSPTNISFALIDNDTDIAAVNMSASSSDTSIIENSGISFIGNQRLRQVIVTPIPGASGTVNITLTATDGSNSNSQIFQVNVVSNLTPSISITSPATNDTILTNTQSFTASANDPEDGDISSSVIWSSSIDGVFASGAAIAATLSDGNHIITASITDSTSNTETFGINITINALSDDDNDGLNNSTEIFLGTDPFDSDTDNDYSSDFEEVNRDGNPNNYSEGVDSDPNNPDTDGDGYQDGFDANPLSVDPPEGNIPLLPYWATGILIALFLLTARKKLTAGKKFKARD
ncbi:hypothetical protein N9F42_04240 [Pseudomonadales bacterium]|nr:hypothetical protein [Pseudomonadales bacterium]